MFPPTINKNSDRFTYSPPHGSIGLFNSNHSNGYFTVALKCISLVINTVEQLLRYLLVTWVFIAFL